MIIPDPVRRTAFLSSTFADDFGAGARAIPLRTRILEAGASLPVELWAYEHEWGGRDAGASPDVDTIIDRCFEGIKRCDLFVFILSGRHGSGAGFVEEGARASYLELELFAAAMLQKPFLVLHYRGRDPGPALLDAMLLLRHSISVGEYVIDNEVGLFNHFLRAARRLAATAPRRPSGFSRRLPQRLAVKRTHGSFRRDLDQPKLLFLDNNLSSRAGVPNPDKALRLLDQVSAGTLSDGRMMPHGVALFRTWAGMREMLDSSGATLRDPATAQLWDRALALWGAKASWFGLHGHLWMGPLAAVNSQSKLRRDLSGEPAFASAAGAREPLGARASAIYSIAQRMRSRERKLYHYWQAAELAAQAMAADDGARQGALSIRGHALMRIGLLGEVWRLWEAADDLEQSLALRQRGAGSTLGIGESMADLGFALVITGRIGRGMSLLQEGVAVMRANAGTADSQAFLARGLRKLERAARLLHRRRLAAAALAERLAISSSIEALDQTRRA